MMATSGAFAASAASGAASRINGRVPRCRYSPRFTSTGLGMGGFWTMVSVGAAWAVWSMMRCNAGRMAGSTAVGWLLAGSQLLWAVPDGGNDDGCGVGSTVVRSASGVACSAPAGGRGGISAKGSVAVAAPAGENTTVSPSPLSPLLPENTAMVGASAASSAARQMVRGLLRSTPPAAPKGGIASAASATIAAGCPATAPAANGPACSPCQALGFNASKAMAFSN